MRDSATTKAVIEILNEINNSRKAADRICSAYFKAHHFIGSNDRRRISECVYTILRNKAKIDWIIQQISSGIKEIKESQNTRLEVLVFYFVLQHATTRLRKEMLLGDRNFQELSIAEEKFFSELQRNDWLTLLNVNALPHVLAEIPEWVYSIIHNQYGLSHNLIRQCFEQPDYICLRVNTLKSSRDNIIVELQRMGITSKVSSFSPWGIRLGYGKNISSSHIFQQGYVEVQDEGSQIISLITQAKPGMRVLDFCAGAGGKTMAIASMMQNKGFILATDVHSDRLQRARERMKRSGIYNVKTQILDKKCQDHFNTSNAYDIVLCDVPCSGSGTWRRNPEARWRLHEEELNRLTQLQTEIINQAKMLVKQDGYLFYSTCSLFMQENESIINQFLLENSSFQLITVQDWLLLNKLEFLQKLLSEDKLFLKILPHKHDMDGFFAAILKRKC
ncbi:MAG: RsmB/NOP family class I SAM-dependent RNA methyltransferase [Alphaproteobacteria bacterium]|nr:RsmB/NOP family class I SAM-dependent RNA methyltransferase [Alphaproteobacteria bacterium]